MDCACFAISMFLEVKPDGTLACSQCGKALTRASTIRGSIFMETPSGQAVSPR